MTPPREESRYLLEPESGATPPPTPGDLAYMALGAGWLRVEIEGEVVSGERAWRALISTATAAEREVLRELIRRAHRENTGT